LVTDLEGRASFLGLPGRYRISKNMFRKKIVDIEDNTAEIEITFD